MRKVYVILAGILLGLLFTAIHAWGVQTGIRISEETPCMTDTECELKCGVGNGTGI